MTLLKRMFAKRSLALKLALACLLVLAVAGLSLLLPRVGRDGVQGPASPAYAAVDGYILLYDFGAVKQESVQGVIDKLAAAVRDFKAAHKLPADGAAQQAHVAVMAEEKQESASNVKEENGEAEESSASETGGVHVIAAVMLPDAALLDELKEALKDVPGLPEPVVTDATWFSEHGWPLPGEDGMRLSVNLADEQHTFTFPKDATTTEMQQAINAWLKEKRPDLTFTVNIEQQGGEKQRRIIVKIRGETPGGAEPVPTPDVSVGEQGAAQGNAELTVKLLLDGNEHTFTFAKSATEAEIEQAVNDWLQSVSPGRHFAVHVRKSGNGDKQQLQISVEKLEEGK